MCRSKEEREGGRRCPHETNPAKVAERNARRREAYRRNKTATAATQTVADATADWVSYGFQPLTESRMGDSLNVVVEESEQEMQHLTSAQAKSLEIFTGTSYRWINGALYGKEETLKYDEDIRQEMRSSSYEDDLKERIANMDSAFMSSPLKERIVYRGKRSSSERFKRDPKKIEKYVDENYALGSEVVFDGYQSASLDPSIAADFSSEDGIIFEMKSRSGINIASQSRSSYEAEVLLPRSTRWRVVGVTKKTKFSSQELMPNGKYYEHSRKNVTVIQMVEVDEIGNELTVRTLPAELTENQLAERTG